MLLCIRMAVQEVIICVYFFQVSDETFRPGTRIMYECPPVYTLEGSAVITCMETGLWDSDPPSCMETQPQNNCV